MLKSEGGVGASETAEERNSEIMRAFKKAVIQNTEAALRDTEAVPAPLRPTLFDRFNDAHGIDIQPIVDRAYYGGGEVAGEGDAEALRRFTQFLYEDPIGPQSDEEDTVLAKTYGSAVDQYEEQLKQAVEARRAKTLPFAIAAFNKI